MSRHALLQRLRIVAVVACQCVVGGVFLFSGVVKCIDPVGTAIKLGDYLRALSLTPLMGWTMELAWLLSLSEFLIGMTVLFAHHRRVFTWLAMAFLAVFTPLTLWLALTDAVSDCGCFGDAVVLTNWQTFWKNVVLILLTAVLCWQRRAMRSPVSHTSFMLHLYCSVAVALWLCWLGTARLPLIDFRPFRPGVHIPTAMGATDATEWQETYGVIYERDGVRREFSLDDLPDEADGWEFVDQAVHRIPIADASGSNPDLRNAPTIRDFFVRNADGEDITAEMLADTTYLFLLVSPSLATASEHDVDRIETVYEYASEHGYGFTCLTVRDLSQIAQWRFRTGAEYPMVFSDATIIETMIRSNPGLVLLKGGTICWKRSLPQVDVELLTSAKLSEQSNGQIQRIERRRRVFFLLALMFGPIALLLLFEMPVRISGRLRRYRKKHNNSKS